MKVIDTWRGEDGTKYGLLAAGHEVFVAISVDGSWQRVAQDPKPATPSRRRSS